MKNQQEMLYNGFGQVTNLYEDHAKAVVTSGGSASPDVLYRYAYVTNAAGATSSNETSTTDPGDRSIDTFYGAQLSLTSITSAGTTTATATTSQPLPVALSVGTPVTISGASPSVYDGIYFVAGINSSTQFTYTMSGTTTVASAAGNDMTVDIVPQSGVTTLSYTNNGTNTTATVTDSAHFTYTIANVQLTGTDTGADIVTINPAVQTLDSAISRATGIEEHATRSPANILEGYNYLGVDTIVICNRPQNNTQLSYVQQPGDTLYSSDGGDQYTGLDRFGRVIDQFWLNSGGSGTTLDRLQYGYDANGNVLYRQNAVNTSFGELYHTNGVATNSSYDNLNRLTNFARGVLSASGSNGTTLDQISSASTTNNWNLDSLGNWSGTGSQTRTVNAQNQYTAISGQTTPTYDHDGNTTVISSSSGFVYDAWNRIVKVTSGNHNVVYETLTFMPGDRASATDVCRGIQTDSYYSMDDQVIEDDAKPTGCGGTTTTSTYVWGMDYVNDLIERDSSSGTSRIYVQHDANWDVTSLVSAGSTPTVLERFDYDPYGTRTVLSASWSLQTEAYSWIYSFQGGRLDTISGLIHFQARDLNTSLGRWMQEDPAGYVDGSDLYQFVTGNPIASLDPMGLDVFHFPHEQLNGAFTSDSGTWLYDLHGFAGRKLYDSRGRSHNMTGVDANIDFWPNSSKICCNDVQIIQIVQESDGDGDYTQFRDMYRGAGARWMDNHGFAVDVWPSAGTPFYSPSTGGQGGFGPPYDAPAKMYDMPYLEDSFLFERRDFYFFFEDFAVCNRGRDAGKVYDGMSWQVGVFHYLLHHEAFLNFYGPWHIAQVVELQLAVAKWDAYRGRSYKFG